ncbi:hypothetical protein [Aeromicrobium sp. CF3.5]|uniref:hypothetical protein n=1 Tax=Aeromicrobium sp. CF3.5 TaxID=3373078 RepID=UPI003EE7BAE4
MAPTRRSPDRDASARPSAGSRHTPLRRRARSAKVIAATSLLALSAVVACAALITSTVQLLAGATVFGVVAGVVSASLLLAEIVVVRRAWATDRAQVSDSYRVETKKRHESHIAFVESLGSRLAQRETQLSAMQDVLLTTEIEIALAREKFSEEKARTEALQSDVDAAASDLASARSDLLTAQDALAASEAAAVEARAEILAWEQVAEQPPKSGERRPA